MVAARSSKFEAMRALLARQTAFDWSLTSPLTTCAAAPGTMLRTRAAPDLNNDGLRLTLGTQTNLADT